MVTLAAIILLVGGRVSNAMKRSLGAGEWIKRGLGVALLASPSLEFLAPGAQAFAFTFG